MFFHCHITIFFIFQRICSACHMGFCHQSHMATAVFQMISFLFNCMATHACFCMATAIQAKWHLFLYLHGNFHLCIGLCAHHIPSFEIAFLADQTFLSFFKLASMATLAGFAWQLLTMPHGNSYSTYMATTSFPPTFHFLRFLPCHFFVHFLYIFHVLSFFLQGEEDYYTCGLAYHQGPTRTPSFKVVNRGQLRCS